jgi:hypothetical protein
MDLVTGVEGIKVLGLIEIPEHGGSVLSTRCTERSIRRDSNSVDVSSVADMISLKSAGGELPDLVLCQ